MDERIEQKSPPASHKHAHLSSAAFPSHGSQSFSLTCFEAEVSYSPQFLNSVYAYSQERAVDHYNKTEISDPFTDFLLSEHICCGTFRCLGTFVVFQHS